MDGEVTNNAYNNTIVEECYCGDLSNDDYPLSYSLYNFMVVIAGMPCVAILGVLGNLLNLVIFTRPRMINNSANTYLAALSISDLFVCVTGVVMFWIDSARAYIEALKYTSELVVTTLPFGLMAQTASVYLVVMASIDCYVKKKNGIMKGMFWFSMIDNKVYCKAAVPRYCTPLASRLIVLGVFVLAILYNCLRFGQFWLHACNPTPDDLMMEICPTPLFWTVNVIYNVYMYIVLMTLLPFMLLSILNALIMKRVQQDARRAQMRQMLVQNIMQRCTVTTTTTIGVNYVPPEPERGFENPDEFKEDMEGFSNDDVVTMIMVVLLFLACNTLALIINIVETFFNPDPIVLNFLTDASNLLVMVNSSVNCFIYLTFNQDYCDIACDLFRRRKKQYTTTNCGPVEPVFLHHPCARGESTISMPSNRVLSNRKTTVPAMHLMSVPGDREARRRQPCRERSMSLITSTTKALSFLHVIEPPERMMDMELHRMSTGERQTANGVMLRWGALNSNKQKLTDTSACPPVYGSNLEIRIQNNPLDNSNGSPRASGSTDPAIRKANYGRTVSASDFENSKRREHLLAEKDTTTTSSESHRHRITPSQIVARWKKQSNQVIASYQAQINSSSGLRKSHEIDTMLTEIEEAADSCPGTPTVTCSPTSLTYSQPTSAYPKPSTSMFIQQNPYVGEPSLLDRPVPSSMASQSSSCLDSTLKPTTTGGRHDIELMDACDDEQCPCYENMPLPL